jgi:hypothetical protein
MEAEFAGVAVKFRNGLVAAAWVAIVIGLLFGPGEKAATQDRFPEAPGRDVLLLACTQCHAIGKMLTAKLTADQWQFTVYDMVARGSPVYADDVQVLTRYLQDNFATDKN